MRRFHLPSVWTLRSRTLAIFLAIQILFSWFVAIRQAEAQLTNAELTRLRKRMVEEYIKAAGVKID